MDVRKQNECRVVGVQITPEFTSGQEYNYQLTCGHLMRRKDGERFCFCDQCGAKVVWGER